MGEEREPGNFFRGVNWVNETLVGPRAKHPSECGASNKDGKITPR